MAAPVLLLVTLKRGSPARAAPNSWFGACNNATISAVSFTRAIPAAFLVEQARLAGPLERRLRQEEPGPE
jgi:hypothetical protein